MKNKCFKEEGWLDFRPDRAKTLLELPEKREREREGGGRDRMALQCNTGAVATSLYLAGNSHRTISNRVELRLNKRSIGVVSCSSSSGKNHNSSGGDGGSKKGVPNSNYVVPMDSSFSSSSITRPLAEILRDLNKRIPDNIVNSSLSSTFIPWYLHTSDSGNFLSFFVFSHFDPLAVSVCRYHANRMLSFYAPGLFPFLP